MLTPMPEHIPDNIARQKRWGRLHAYWDETKKSYNKDPQGGPLDKPYPLSFKNIEYLVTLREVMKVIETNPYSDITLVPAYAQLEDDPLFSMDVDKCFIAGTKGQFIDDIKGRAAKWVIDNFESYTEISLSDTGLHMVFWWSDKKSLPVFNIANNPELKEIIECIELKNAGWLSFSGHIYYNKEDGRNYINDLTDSPFLSAKNISSKGNLNVNGVFVDPFTMPEQIGVGKREPTIYALTWALASKNLRFETILLAILNENKYFASPHNETYVKNKVIDSYKAYMLKAEIKNVSPVVKKPKTRVDRDAYLNNLYVGVKND